MYMCYSRRACVERVFGGEACSLRENRCVCCMCLMPLCCAGVFNDLGSGSNVDLCIITKNGAEMKRNYEFLQTKVYSRQFPIDFKATPSTVTKEKTLVPMVTLSDVAVVEGEPEAMDTDA